MQPPPQAKGCSLPPRHEHRAGPCLASGSGRRETVVGINGMCSALVRRLWPPGHWGLCRDPGMCVPPEPCLATGAVWLRPDLTLEQKLHWGPWRAGPLRSAVRVWLSGRPPYVPKRRATGPPCPAPPRTSPLLPAAPAWHECGTLRTWHRLCVCGQLPALWSRRSGCSSQLREVRPRWMTPRQREGQACIRSSWWASAMPWSLELAGRGTSYTPLQGQLAPGTSRPQLTCDGPWLSALAHIRGRVHAPRDRATESVMCRPH